MTPTSTISPLDRRLPLPGWYGLTALGILLMAFLLRFIDLDGYLLNAREATWAYDSWSFFYGRPLPAGQSLPDSGPMMLIWNSVGYILFGVTDATARIGSALIGVGMVALVYAMRPYLSRLQITCTAALLAISPTVVFASRTIEPGILAAFLAVLSVLALVHIGGDERTSTRWTGLLGFAVAALYAVGPLGVTTLFALGVGVLAAGINDRSHGCEHGAVGAALTRLGASSRLLLVLVGTMAVTLVVLFSRLLTNLDSLQGIYLTVSDWTSMMADGTSNIGSTFYFWSLMLYETAAVLICIVTLIVSRSGAREKDANTPTISVPLYVGWFATALLLHSFSSSRDTGSAVLVVLPVLLLAGHGLGRMLETRRTSASVVRVVGAVVGVVLVAYTLSGSIGLAFTRGESGSEPLARDIPAEQAGEFLDQVMRLSRDISVTQPSKIDPTGRFGLNVKVTPEYEWPFTWYFRNFPQFSVTPAAGFDEETDVAIASTADAMDSVGLTPSTRVWLLKPSDPLSTMRTGQILRTGLNPLNWGNAWDFMVMRETESGGDPTTITVGYSARIMNKLTTNTGPFNLFDSSSPGAGGALGQLNAPTGITVDANGVIYVLNSGNARVDRYSADGTFLGIWNGQVDSALQLSWNGWQGGTGIHVGPDGLVYIADTWNHAVIVVGTDGKVVRVLGNRGVVTDIGDGGDIMSSPGVFFGPRDIAISEDRIYITDTGNERVQVFAKDGTFVTSFGGFGSADGQFTEPTGIALAPDGTIWVADSGNARLQQFDADGTWLASYDVPEWVGLQGIDRLNLLAFNADGVLFYTLPNQGVFAWSNGESVMLDNIRIQRPGGIAFDADGSLLVTDNANATVVRVDVELPAGFGSGLATPSASPVATPQE